MLDAEEARTRYVQMLTERLRRERFPSVNHMDRLEAALTPQTAGPYLEMLLEKIADDKYPSPTMLARIENVASQLPTRAALRRAAAAVRSSDEEDEDEDEE